jgi:hypothetical protein
MRTRDPHQPHAKVCPGRRRDCNGPFFGADLAPVVVFVSPVFMRALPQ